MRLWLAVIALLLAGCVLPPPESPHPHVRTAKEVGLLGVPVGPTAQAWWKSFGDPQLDRLIRLGLKANPTLAQAQARVAAALGEVQTERSGLLPSADLAAGVSYQRAPANYLVPPPYAAHTFWLGQAGASLGWDLDFWGRQADAVRRAQDLAGAAHLDHEQAKLMLAGAITQAYLELYREHALAAIAERSEVQRQRILAITRRRVAAGLDTQLELQEAQGEVPQARVEREQADAAAGLAVHELAELTGQGADAYGSLHFPVLKVEATLPVPSTLPMNLLSRRPDVLSARLHVEAADAQRLSTRAAFYPDVNLRGLAGFASFGLHDLVQWSARGYGAGPLLSLPLFDGGRLRGEYRSSEAQLDAAIDAYDDTVLKAVREVADELTRLDALAREETDQRLTLTATERAYGVAEERYRAGLASYLSVLNAETQVLLARQTMVDIVAAQAEGRVRLLLSVGGSFDPLSRSSSVLSHTAPGNKP